MPDPASIESYLPKMSENPTLATLLHGYGKYWMSQPSLSGYQRHYSLSPDAYSGPPHYMVITPRNLVAWEGYPGHYDAYGDFEDDDSFYNESVKAHYLFWHIDQEGSVIRFRGPAGGKYKSLAELRDAIITKWPTVTPTLGEQGERWHAFIAENLPNVVSLLQEVGLRWRVNYSTRCLIYPIENYVYLARWIGEPDAVQPPPAYDHRLQGHPVIAWEQVKKISIFRVALKRLRIRFSLEQPYKVRDVPAKYSYVDGASGIRTFEELDIMVRKKLSQMTLV